MKNEFICITVNSTKRSLIIRSRSAPKTVLARAILVPKVTKSFVGSKQASMISGDILAQLLLIDEGIKISRSYYKHFELGVF